MNDSAAVKIRVLNEHQPMYMAQVRRSLARNSVLAVHPKPTYTTSTNKQTHQAYTKLCHPAGMRVQSRKNPAELQIMASRFRLRSLSDESPLLRL